MHRSLLEVSMKFLKHFLHQNVIVAQKAFCRNLLYLFLSSNFYKILLCSSMDHLLCTMYIVYDRTMYYEAELFVKILFAGYLLIKAILGYLPKTLRLP